MPRRTAGSAEMKVSLGKPDLNEALPAFPRFFFWGVANSAEKQITRDLVRLETKRPVRAAPSCEFVPSLTPTGGKTAFGLRNVPAACFPPAGTGEGPPRLLSLPAFRVPASVVLALEEAPPAAAGGRGSAASSELRLRIAPICGCIGVRLASQPQASFPAGQQQQLLTVPPSGLATLSFSTFLLYSSSSSSSWM